MPTEQGFSNQKKKGSAQFKTIHQLGSGRYGGPVSSKGLTEILLPAAITAVTPVLNRDGQLEYWEIEIAAHGAAVNDILRMETSALVGWEYDITSIVDANTFRVLATSDLVPQVADTASIMRWVTQKLSLDGSISASVTTAPAQFILNGASQQVVENWTIPSLNRPMPQKTPASPLGFALLDFSVSNVTDVAYQQLMASSGAARTTKVQIFMSSGAHLYLAFGAAGFEVDSFVIIPGGNGLIDFEVPAATRLSLKAVDAATTVNSGRIIMNLLG